MCPRPTKTDDVLNSRSLDLAYERAIEDLFGQAGRQGPLEAAESAPISVAIATVVRQSEPTVPKCSSVTRGVVYRPDSQPAKAPTHGYRDESSWVGRLRLSVIFGCLALAAFLIAGSTPASWRTAFGGPTGQPKTFALTPLAAPRDGELQLVPIERVQVGDRVIGTNPIHEEAEQVEPDPESWRKLSFQMRKEDGLPLWIDLLRPLEWIEANGIEQGKTTFLNFPEMGAVGDADATYVGLCPPIKGGKGTVVTGKFTQQSDSSNVVRLQLEGQGEATGVTRNHPYWSQDRRGYVEVGKLRIGEIVATEFGLRHVVSIEPCNYQCLLYNLETTEHVYRVGSIGSLVHNSCGVYKYMTKTGPYIGSTGNFGQRLAQWRATGRLQPGVPVKKIRVTGGRTAREIREQLEILKTGGLANTINKRNPIGIRRAYLLPLWAQKSLGYR